MPMSNELEIVCDETGVAIYGIPDVVEQFVETVPSLLRAVAEGKSKAISLSAAAQTGSAVATNSGRWIKLTAESAADLKAAGALMPTGTSGVSYGMLGKPGKIKKWIKVDSAATAKLTNPQLLAGAAGIMAQVAMQQQIDAIVDYLEMIDKKLDSVLRTQTNQVLARLGGVDLAVQEAFSVRSAVGRVSDITWSKVQAVSQTLNEVQAFAILQMDEVANRFEEAKTFNQVQDATRYAEEEVSKWLRVLAHCFELQEQMGILELDRVLDGNPDEIDQHRLGLHTAREERMKMFRTATETVLARLGAAADAANSKVLFNPIDSPKTVAALNETALNILGIWSTLDIDSSHESTGALMWREAAAEQLDKARDISASGMDKVRGGGQKALDSARATAGNFSGKLAEKRKRGTDG